MKFTMGMPKEDPMQACTATPEEAISQARLQRQQPPSQADNPRRGPICCKQHMEEMVRRAIVRGDGKVNFCSVWQCDNCGRLLL